MAQHFICTALRDSLKKGYTIETLKKDVMAGLIVSLVALPLAMALSITVGLPPQHGLFTAIVAGFIVPLLGGSQVQVSGPTAAFVVILIPIVSQHGLFGLMMITMMAGFLLILLGVSRVGRYIEYVPHTVITGFTSGIAVVIGTLALHDLLGLKIHMTPGSYLHQITCIIQHMPTLYGPECFIGLLSLAIMWGTNYCIPQLPGPLMGIGIGMIGAYFFQQWGYTISTIGNHFSYILPDGTQGYGIPPLWPSLLNAVKLLSWPSIHEWQSFFMPACIVAALGGLESLLSTAVADKMTHKKHNPHAELIGIGIGNILSGLVSGIPATGAIARTAKNIRNGAQTPLAASFHALFILMYVLLLTPVLSLIPMAALAALLVRVSIHMFHYEAFVRTSPWQDMMILIVSFLLTIFVDMVVGVSVGIVLALVFRCSFRN